MNNTWFLKFVKKFFQPVPSMKKTVIMAIIPFVLISMITIILVNLIKHITNEFQNWNIELVKYNLWIFIGTVIIYYIILVVSRNRKEGLLRPEFRKYFYKYYIKKFLLLDNNEAEKVWTWKLIAMIDKWLNTWVDLLVSTISNIIPWTLTIIFSFIFIAIINKYYALVVFIVFILLSVITIYQEKKAQKLRKVRTQLNIEITRRLVKILMSKFEVLQNNKWFKEADNIAQSLNKNKEINFQVMDLRIWVTLLLRLIIDWSKIWIIVFYMIWLWNSTLNYWEFVSLISITYMLDQILNQFIGLYIDFSNKFVEVEKLWEFFDENHSMDRYIQWKEFTFSKWDITLKNINFWYKDQKILDNFSLSITWWQKIAFVWPSGWWKTTIMKLIAWYLINSDGDIEVDGQSLSELSLQTYYKHIWYLTQEPNVFDGTIIENLTYSLTDNEISSPDFNKKLEEIMKLAKCEFIWNLEKGLETEIWERWVRLSWGQKQRLAIAKLMLKNPEIIFLDEPTSAMDSFNEEEVTIALNNLFKWKTVIIIAHRLQTVKQADIILYIENWKIIESGNHEQLIKLWGKYKAMLEIQNGF